MAYVNVVAVAATNVADVVVVVICWEFCHATSKLYSCN